MACGRNAWPKNMRITGAGRSGRCRRPRRRGQLLCEIGRGGCGTAGSGRARRSGSGSRCQSARRTTGISLRIGRVVLAPDAGMGAMPAGATRPWSGMTEPMGARVPNGSGAMVLSEARQAALIEAGGWTAPGRDGVDPRRQPPQGRRRHGPRSSGGSNGPLGGALARPVYAGLCRCRHLLSFSIRRARAHPRCDTTRGRPVPDPGRRAQHRLTRAAKRLSRRNGRSSLRGPSNPTGRREFGAARVARSCRRRDRVQRSIAGVMCSASTGALAPVTCTASSQGRRPACRPISRAWVWGGAEALRCRTAPRCIPGSGTSVRPPFRGAHRRPKRRNRRRRRVDSDVAGRSRPTAACARRRQPG